MTDYVSGYMMSGNLNVGNVNAASTVVMGSSFLRNRIINGGMQVAQYGTSCQPGTTSTYNYAMDRFLTAINSGLASGYTISQLSQANTGLTGFYNSLRYQRNSGNTNTTTMAFGQTIETANCYDLAGQTCTLSFWARAGSNFSAASSQITARIATGTGVDQGSSGGYNGTWTGYANTNTLVTITTTWTRYTVTASIGASVNEIQILFYWAGTGTAGTNDYVDITGVQFEAGSFATPFERRLFTHELQLCQRYYEKSYDLTSNPGTNTENGMAAGYFNATGGINQRFSIFFKVTKRSVPNVLGWDAAGNANKCSAWNSGNARTDNLATGSRFFGLIGMQSAAFNEANLGAYYAFGTHWTAESEI